MHQILCEMKHDTQFNFFFQFNTVNQHSMRIGNVQLNCCSQKKLQHKSTAQLVTGSSLTVNQHAILEFSQDTHQERAPSFVQIQQSEVVSRCELIWDMHK